MALYLGSSEKLNISTPNGVFKLTIQQISNILNKIILLSSDNYILKDSNGLTLTVKESE